MSNFNFIGAISIYGGILAVGTILIISIYHKISSGINLFSRQLEAYKLIPSKYSKLLAYAIVLGEITVALMIVVRPFTIHCLFGILLLGILFLAAQTSALMRKMTISCGCHGEGSNPVSYKTMIYPILFISVAAAGICMKYAAEWTMGMFLSALLLGLAIVVSIKTVFVYGD